jgi:hypothetical protein
LSCCRGQAPPRQKRRIGHNEVGLSEEAAWAEAVVAAQEYTNEDVRGIREDLREDL